MRFLLIDKIVELELGQSITAHKLLTGSERYLIDHFPNFACMPGVLMLEAMFQAGAWLLRETDNFQRPTVMLKEVRNVKYGTFVEPGQTLIVNVSIQKQIDEHTFKLKGQGTVEGKPAVSGLLICDRFCLSERFGVPEVMDQASRREYRSVYAKLQQTAAVEAV